MCGIVGAIHFHQQPVAAYVIEHMANVLHHRGPDDAGVFVDGIAGLGHRRLKIIDLSPAGHQPMSNEDGTVWVTYNGEIYNFQELREELCRRGHRFSSRTDTEVIVHAYEEWGERCVERFNGMFALGLWNAQQKKLVLMRDRLGIKPLFYYLDAEKFLFASEIKGILQHPQVNQELDHSAIYDYFSLNYIPSPKTPFTHIRALLPGHWLTVQDGRLAVVQYWDVHYAGSRPEQAESQYTEEILHLLQDAVRCRLIADVPLGAFLSGGVDSSAIVYFMKRSGHGALKTFHVGFPEKTYDESSYARLAARHVGTDHYEVCCQPDDFENLLETIAWHADNLTADISMVPMYLLAQRAREQVTVVLSGDGGDELFGGYLTYQADILASYYRRLPAWLRRYLVQPIVAALPSSSRKQSLDYKLKKFIEGASFPPDKSHYTWRTIFSDGEKPQVLSREFLETIDDGDTTACYHRHFSKANAQSVMDKIFYADLKVFLADSILAKVDSMTMAHALEAREPLLDYRLVELSARIPPDLKIKRLDTKYIFKQAMVSRLPHQIIFRKKEGFHPPIASWFRRELRPFVEEVLCGENLREIGMLNPAYVEELKQRHFAGLENNAFKLWGLMNFIAWHTQVVKGRRVPNLRSATSHV
jgi:asparagine synthase (glutamine-hydrolysing)